VEDLYERLGPIAKARDLNPLHAVVLTHGHAEAQPGLPAAEVLSSGSVLTRPVKAASILPFIVYTPFCDPFVLLKGLRKLRELREFPPNTNFRDLRNFRSGS
jgi:hypothetical protein